MTVVHPRFPARRQSARAGHWWGRAWVRAIEEAAYSATDLLEARALSRSGNVGQIMVEPGRFVASVEDSQGLATVAGTIPVLDHAGRAGLAEAIGAESGRVAALVAGDLPHGLVEHAEEAGVELLPFGGELGGECTCQAWTDPCVHALAVLYQLTWLIEADPFVLFHLRGLPREELLGLVRRHDADLDVAHDAALRAARVMALLEDDPTAGVDHLLG
ncbi:SWIM zinc finger family protein [Nocardioides sp.]|uniref:SWIM zinc finger family protein n=1 Tax=Nocardioides sp. TaxID=35761 RepID=UPI003561F72A